MVNTRQRGQTVTESEVGPPRAADAVLAIVLEIIAEDGCEAVALREVARRARVSLGTVYKWFPTRDDLIVTTLQRWMAANNEPAATAAAGRPSGCRTT